MRFPGDHERKAGRMQKFYDEPLVPLGALVWCSRGGVGRGAAERARD